MTVEPRTASVHTQPRGGREVIRNGIAVDQVQAYVDLLGAQPAAGAVTLRTRHRWEGGYSLEWHAEELTLAGEGFSRTHTMRIDMPEEFGGGDSGPVPGEALLAALGACVGQQLVEHAAMRGVDVEGLQIICEAQLDLRGAYGLESVRPGMEGVSVTAHVRSHVEDAVLDSLLRDAMQTSPAADSLANPVPLLAAVGGRG